MALCDFINTVLEAAILATRYNIVKITLVETRKRKLKKFYVDFVLIRIYSQ